MRRRGDGYGPWMSSDEDPYDVPEPEWRTHCEHCGHELEQVQVAVMEGGDEQQDAVVAQDVCPNEACPSRASQA